MLRRDHPWQHKRGLRSNHFSTPRQQHFQIGETAGFHSQRAPKLKTNTRLDTQERSSVAAACSSSKMTQPRCRQNQHMTSSTCRARAQYFAFFQRLEKMTGKLDINGRLWGRLPLFGSILGGTVGTRRSAQHLKQMCPRAF